MQSLTDGLSRLHDNAVAMVRNEGRDVISRFGQMGARRLEAVS